MKCLLKSVFGRSVLHKSAVALLFVSAAGKQCVHAQAAQPGQSVQSVQGAQSVPLAPVPPMGWNSWDAYGTTVTEAEVKANADAMAAALKAYGWQYIVVDIQWYEPNAKAHGYRKNAVLALDAYGRLMPAANRFPSAANGAGFKQLADYVHSKGLKFGIHILRGIPRQAVDENLQVQGTSLKAKDIANPTSTCAWNSDMVGVDMTKPGAQAYYDSIVQQYADWGVDFIKADDMTRPYHADEIAALHKAIVKSGRPIVLSLSPGPAPTQQLDHLRANAEMWRIEDDLWDKWESLKTMYAHAEKWLPLVAAGHWPDADMLPLGRIGIRAERGDDRMTRLTHDEQQTMMTLWAMLHSPLIFGGDLPSLDDFTRALLTNGEVLAISQHSHGSRLVLSQADLHVWEAEGQQKGDLYVAIFNFADQATATTLDANQLHWPGQPQSMEDLWQKIKLNPGASQQITTAAHGVTLLKLRFAESSGANSTPTGAPR